MNPSTAPFTPTQQQGMQDLLNANQQYGGVVNAGLQSLLGLAGGGRPEIKAPQFTPPGGVQPGGIPGIPTPIPNPAPGTVAGGYQTYPGITPQQPQQPYTPGPQSFGGGGIQMQGDPMQALLGGGGGAGVGGAQTAQTPYVPSQGWGWGDPANAGALRAAGGGMPGGTAASGTGGKDPAYLQNMADYAQRWMDYRKAVGREGDDAANAWHYKPGGPTTPWQDTSYTMPTPSTPSTPTTTPPATTAPDAAATPGATTPAATPAGGTTTAAAGTGAPAAPSPGNPGNAASQINPYLDPYYQAAANTMTTLYKNATAPSQMSAAVQSGAFGGSADAMQRALGQFQLGQNLANLGAQIYEPAWAQQQQLGFQEKQLGQQGSLAREQMALQHTMQGEQLAAQSRMLAQQGDIQGALQRAQLAAQEQMLGQQLGAQQSMLGQQLGAEQAMQSASLAAQQAMQGQSLAAQQALASQQMNLQQQQMAMQNAYNTAALQSQTQLGALGMLPQFASMLYTPGQTTLGVGGMQQGQLQNILNNITGGAQQMQQYPYNVLQQYGGGLTSMLGPFSGTQLIGTQPSQGSKL